MTTEDDVPPTGLYPPEPPEQVTTEAPSSDKVVSLEAFLKTRTENKNKPPESVTVLGGKGTEAGANKFPNAETPKMRRYLIDMKDDTIEIEGFVGLTGSFLAIGDEEGRIKFGAASGEWLCVTDITDTGKHLKDYLGSTPE